MPINYTQILSSDMIVAEIETLLDWYVQVIRFCYYPDARKAAVESQPPSSLLVWCKQQADKGGLDAKNVENLNAVYDGVYASARDCVAASVPTLEQYNALANHLEGYITHLRRMQHDMADAGMSVDPVTGLRTVSGMLAELKREQDRFNRKGTSFSVANIELDHVEELQAKFDRHCMDVFVAHLAQNIAKTVRSFDDAYYLGKGEYVVVLKHLDFMDACAVMDRLRASIESIPVLLETGEQVSLTASFGLAEAIQKEQHEFVLEHAKIALKKAKHLGGNRISEYKDIEVSPFEAFIQGSQG